ncbi:HPP family protein [Lewinella sp. W8]|uniref:CBS domain-containing protein n=1 Tax=Lewinella sp. W8 TaxID=2528208 RepID=UPI001068C135|nr:CBS domain-containing protein [Lewinella sp. W8]MTB50944.1 CBS domain-containing protein [Lewinella sp. W8]
MNAKVHDLMVDQVITTVPHKSVGHARDLMQKHHIKSIPIINNERDLLGLVTSADVLKQKNLNTPLSDVMITKVYTVPEYADVHIAARIMRNHRIHHLIVTHEGKVSGIISAFDLMQLVENHRFVAKNPPTPSKKSRRS